MIIPESWFPEKYENADKVLMVPKEFKSISQYKVKALDYSSQIRNNLNINKDDVKILYLDNDSIPSKGYIEKCFSWNYDEREVINPKLKHGTHYSYIYHLANMR